MNFNSRTGTGLHIGLWSNTGKDALIALEFQERQELNGFTVKALGTRRRTGRLKKFWTLAIFVIWICFVFTDRNFSA